jgi:hypothetical protein
MRIDLKFVELFSVIITPLVISSCLLVIIIYGKQAHRAILNSGLREMDPGQCLIVGIVFGFVGKVIDNAYWAIPWMSSLFESPSSDFWFKHGVLLNIPFRQVCCIVSALFHVFAAAKMKQVNFAVAPTILLTSILYMIAIYILFVEAGW